MQTILRRAVLDAAQQLPKRRPRRPRRRATPPRRILALRRTPPHLRNMHAFVEVVGPGHPDTSSSVQLFFDEARYLFDCGDGTQRLCTEHAIKLTKLRSILLTSLSAPSVGGLFGLILTVADVGIQALSVVAPSGIKQLFRDARSFYHRPALDADIRELDMATAPPKLPLPVLTDTHVTIQAVPILARRDKVMDVSFGGHYDAVSYIARLNDLRGKFDPAAAKRLGVPQGKLFGVLQSGNPVTTPDGKTVNPSDVMSPGTPGPVVLVVACPTADHIRSLTSSAALRRDALRLADSSSAGFRRCIVVHFTPRDVLTMPDYREWADALGDQVVHIPVHASVTRPHAAFASQAENIELLHSTVDKEIFPLPHNTFEPLTPEPSPSEAEEVDEQSATQGQSRNGDSAEAETADKPENASAFARLAERWKGQWLEAQTRLRFTLAPASNVGLDRKAVRPRFAERGSHPTKRQWREYPAGTDMPPSPESRMATPECITSMSRGTAALRFFGTGAAIPGKLRNVSASMVDLYARGAVLFDCGEGSWGQMARQFGPDIERGVAGLRVVFISHMHADHHLGLPRLLHERAAMIRRAKEGGGGGIADGLPQLVIIGPTALAAWLEGFQAAARVPLRDKVGPDERAFRFFDAKSLTDPQTSESKFFADTFGLEFGCVRVEHCPDAYGVVMRDCVGGWSVLYSGDTRPCDALARAGRGVTVAIHEATLEDGLSEEAVDKMHCTMSEAVDVCADGMGAWRTILTHFSQRYPRIPKLGAGMRKKLLDGRAGVATDLMFVDFTRLQELPRAVVALKESFPDEYSEDEVEVEVGPEVGPEGGPEVVQP